MGTLFDQNIRTENIKEPGYRIVSYALDLCNNYSFLKFSDALKCIELDFKIDDYDIRDEQMGGLGHLLENLIEVINDKNLSN